VNPWTVHDKNDTATSKKLTTESLGFQEATSTETARKFPAVKPWVGGETFEEQHHYEPLGVWKDTVQTEPRWNWISR
jgi:hypothetical protein